MFELADLELLGAFLAVFMLNMIPFIGPSNLLIAVNVASIFALDPLTVGPLVAAGATAAKMIHYFVVFFLRRALGRERTTRFHKYFSKIGRWALLAIFVTAATPIPDEPVMIPLALMRYNPAKFCLSYFLGKLVIALLGAYLGFLARIFIGSSFGDAAVILTSIILTALVVVVMIKVDVDTFIVWGQGILYKIRHLL